MAEEETYRGMRYPGPHIRDEVVLRTACGCEKLISAFEGQHTIRVPLDGGRLRGSFGPRNPVESGRYMVRRFVYEPGLQDSQGRPVFTEWLEQVDYEDWKHRYQELYKDVYGMDKGL